jgi:hypothetical protein
VNAINLNGNDDIHAEPFVNDQLNIGIVCKLVNNGVD